MSLNKDFHSNEIHIYILHFTFGKNIFCQKNVDCAVLMKSNLELFILSHLFGDLFWI